MCGIVMIMAKNDSYKFKLGQLFSYAYKNIHRGDDGWGYVDFTRKRIGRGLTSLKDINTYTLRTVKSKKQRKKAKKFEIIKDICNLETQFAILHHRAASVGDVDIINTHPIKITKNIYYLHNGTLFGHAALRKYLEDWKKLSFVTKTDTELAAVLYEDYINTNTNASKHIDAATELKRMFYNIGVFVRCDVDARIAYIMKDSSRDLYLYDFDDYKLLISEPLKEIKDYNYVKYIEKNYFKVGDKSLLESSEKGISYDETTNIKDAIIKYEHFKMEECSECKQKKQVFKRTKKYICMNCYLREKRNKKEVITIDSHKSLVVIDNDEKEETTEDKKELDIKEVPEGLQNMFAS